MLKEFADKYESYFNEHINITKEYPEISDIEKNIFDLFNIMGINEFQDFNIRFKIPNFTELNNNSKYWGSGTGYGYEGTTQWDINSFIAEQNNITKKVIKILENIRIMFEKYENKDKIKKIMGKFITNQLRGTNLFDFNKNIDTSKKIY